MRARRGDLPGDVWCISLVQLFGLSAALACAVALDLISFIGGVP